MAMMSVWMAGGALAFAGAMAYAELAAVRPAGVPEAGFSEASTGGLRAGSGT